MHARLPCLQGLANAARASEEEGENQQNEVADPQDLDDRISTGEVLVDAVHAGEHQHRQQDQTDPPKRGCALRRLLGCHACRINT